MVRAAVDSARQDAPGMVNLILRCCVNALLSAVDFLNKFTINFVAITGESYCTSARMTYELLKRNLLSAVFVETISSRLLAGIIFVLSAIYAIVVCSLTDSLIILLPNNVSPLITTPRRTVTCQLSPPHRRSAGTSSRRSPRLSPEPRRSSDLLRSAMI